MAGERRYRGYRTDQELVYVSSSSPCDAFASCLHGMKAWPDELDLDETVEETASNAGRLSLVWRKSRKNAVKVLLLMDVGGSMHPYIRLCSQLFSAVDRSTHFKETAHLLLPQLRVRPAVHDHAMTSSEAI